MKAKRSVAWSLLAACLLGLTTPPVSALAQTKSVVISELILNREQPAQSWVELYNPTDTTIVVKYFRLSHIKTPSVFPPEINRLGGIAVPPGQYVILCADTQQFAKLYGPVARCVQVPLLNSLADGGFVAAGTAPDKSGAADLVRYGNAEYSSNVALASGSEVVSFTTGGRSYAREVIRSPFGYQLSIFANGSPTPGR